MLPRLHVFSKKIFPSLSVEGRTIVSNPALLTHMQVKKERGSLRRKKLTLRELRRTTGTTKTVFLTFDPTGVSRQEITVSQDRFKLAVKVLQRPGDTQLASVGLTGLATTVDTDDHVDIAELLGRLQRREDRVFMLLKREKIFHCTFIYRDRSVP